MNILVTGANGFIAKNLIIHLLEKKYNILKYTLHNTQEDLKKLVLKADFIFHTAGINRPDNSKDFYSGNSDLTAAICSILKDANKNTPIVYTSSIQAELNNDYGKSKKLAEDHLLNLCKENRNLVYIYRLNSVFGKWSKPNYNSVVSTFCHNISHNLPIEIRDSNHKLHLVYIDDVVESFLNCLNGNYNNGFITLQPYEITLGELAKHLYAFKDSKNNHIIESVGNGLIRALYSTYISYYDVANFSYPLLKHEDSRGIFVEMLKTKDSGQFSFFTAHSGITRGGHYHHTKTEKFLVIKGSAKFRFRHIVTNEYYEKFTNGDNPEIVETIPGWSHDITNIGTEEMLVMLWANEIFDQDKPDTITYKLEG